MEGTKTVPAPPVTIYNMTTIPSPPPDFIDPSEGLDLVYKDYASMLKIMEMCFG